MSLAVPGTTRADLERRLLAHARAAAHPLLAEWLGEAALLETLRESVAGVVTRLLDDELAAGFQSCVPLAGVPAAAYKNRLFTDEAAGEWVAGIRFQGLDPSRPFVDVVLAERPLEDASTLDRVVARCMAEFAPFRPGRVRVHRSSHRGAVPPRLEPDLLVLAAPIAEIASRPAPSGAARVEVNAGSVAARFEAYVDACEQLLAERPELRGVVRIESAESLQACEDAGLLFEIRIDGRWGGLVALDHGFEQGLRGLGVTVFLLTGGFRGQRLAAAAQWSVVRALPRELDTTILFGTIAGTNTPSQRTALSLGRMPLGGYYFASPT